MGRVGTHLTDVSSGWGPSGRRFKSGLPDSPEARVGRGFSLCSYWGVGHAAEEQANHPQQTGNPTVQRILLPNGPLAPHDPLRRRDDRPDERYVEQPPP